MIKCPKCARPAEPQERYCSFCHTVFPSDTKAAASLRLATGSPSGWKIPVLVFIGILGAIFVQIDVRGSAQAGSIQAVARDTKRAIVEWVTEYTGFEAAP